VLVERRAQTVETHEADALSVGGRAKPPERTLAREVGSEQPPCTDEQSAELLVALSDLAVRDDCWRRMERGGQEQPSSRAGRGRDS